MGSLFFLISDFKLDVDSPYPIPTRETLKAKPEVLPYPKNTLNIRTWVKTWNLLFRKALKEEQPEKRSGFANSIAYYMKLAYNTWHKELVHDDAIRRRIERYHQWPTEIYQYSFRKAYRERDNRENNRFQRGGGKNFQQRNGGR